MYVRQWQARSVAPSGGGRRGFTLIELLIVIVLISTLLAILLTSIARSRQQSRQMICTLNTRQITTGMMAFAADYKGYFVGETQVGDDSLAYLQRQGYLDAVEVVICPDTENRLDESLPPGQQLDKAARHAHDRSGGHSYETFHHYSTGQFPGFTINEHKRLTTRDRIPQDESFIVIDSDNDPGGGGMNDGYFGFNNMPDEQTNNHGSSGMNIAFLDGGARFIPADQWIAVNIASGHMDGYSTDMVRAQQVFEPRLQWAPRVDDGPGLRYWLDTQEPMPADDL